jgi:drug/metabolite transporter (DMT)-like permease
MPPLALALVLTAALLHALWNIAAKRAGGDHRFVLMGALLHAAIWAPVGVVVGWQVVPRWGALEWALVLASGLVHLAYFNALLKGYRESDLTVVYPVARGTGPLVTAAAAVLLLGEVLAPLALAGVLTVAFGVFLIAGGPRLVLRARAHDPAQRARVRAGLLWGGATGLLIAGYTVIDGYAVKVVLMSPILVDYFSNLVRIPFMLPGALRDRAGFATAWRAQWKHALVLAVCAPLAYVLVLYAMTMAPLAHVAPAREVSMLFAALIGARLLGEGDRAARLAGAGCIAAGVAALALA